MVSEGMKVCIRCMVEYPATTEHFCTVQGATNTPTPGQAEHSLWADERIRLALGLTSDVYIDYIESFIVPAKVALEACMNIRDDMAQALAAAQEHIKELEEILGFGIEHVAGQRIAELTAQLAERSEYEPVPDGKYCNESPDGSEDWCIKITDSGDSIWQWSSSNGEWIEIGSLSFWGFVLCRRVQREDE